MLVIAWGGMEPPMVERNKKFNKDKQRADREKKIKKVVSKNRNEVNQDLRRLTKGDISPDDFEEKYED